MSFLPPIMERYTRFTTTNWDGPRLPGAAFGISRRRQTMYYRVAIRQGDQLPTWQWTSTVLSSLQTLFQFLRLYGGLSQDRLRVFLSSSRESLQEQLVQENQGFSSQSVMAAQFLQERMIHSPEVSQGTSACETGRHQEQVVSAKTQLNENSEASNPFLPRCMNQLSKRQMELELGSGGDHDVPYRFALPLSRSQVLAWMRLLVKVQCGELEP